MIEIQVLVLSSWLAADFLTGVFHWFEDKYLLGGTLNFLDSIAEDNDLHHRKPTAMLLSTGWTNMKSSAAAAWPASLACWWFGMPAFVWLTLFFVAFGNLIHRWSHRPKSQLPRWIRAMQELGLFISQEHHDEHHRSMKQLIPKHLAGCKFCGMTDWLNPALDAIRFWDGLECLVRKLGFKTVAERID